MDTQPLKLQVDSKQAQADLSALAKALDTAGSAVGRMQSKFASGMSGTDEALQKSMKSMEKFAEVATLLGKIKVSGEPAQQLREFANALNAMSRAKAIDAGQIAGIKTLTRTLAELKVPTGAARLTEFLNAVGSARAPSEGAVLRLKDLLKTLSSYQPSGATRNVQALSTFFATISNIRAPSEATIQRLQKLFAVLAEAKAIPGASKIAADLNHVSEAAARAGAAFGTMPARMNAFAPAAERATKGAAGLHGELSKTPKHAQAAESGFARVGNSLGILGERFKVSYQLGTVFSAFFTSFTVGQFLKGIYDTGIEMQKLNKALLFSTGSFKGAQGAMQEYIGMAQDLGLNVDKSAESFLKFTISAKASGMNFEQSTNVYKSVAQTLQIVGASSEQAGLALYGLTEMMQKGEVLSKEFNRQIGAQIPGNAVIGARAMSELQGKYVSVAEFFKQMSKGQVLSPDFVPAWAKALREEYGDLKPLLEMRPDVQLNKLVNAFILFKKAIGDSGFMVALGNEFKRLTNMLVEGEGPATHLKKNVQELAEELGKNFADMIHLAGNALAFVLQHIPELISTLKGLAALKVGATFIDWGKGAAQFAGSLVVVKKATEDTAKAEAGATAVKRVASAERTASAENAIAGGLGFFSAGTRVRGGAIPTVTARSGRFARFGEAFGAVVGGLGADAMEPTQFPNPRSAAEYQGAFKSVTPEGAAAMAAEGRANFLNAARSTVRPGANYFAEVATAGAPVAAMGSRAGFGLRTATAEVETFDATTKKASKGGGIASLLGSLIGLKPAGKAAAEGVVEVETAAAKVESTAAKAAEGGLKKLGGALGGALPLLGTGLVGAALAAGVALAAFGDHMTTVGGKQVQFNDIVGGGFKVLGDHLKSWWDNAGKNLGAFGVTLGDLGKNSGEIVASIVAGFVTLGDVIGRVFSGIAKIAEDLIMNSPLVKLVEIMMHIASGDMKGAGEIVKNYAKSGAGVVTLAGDVADMMGGVGGAIGNYGKTRDEVAAAAAASAAQRAATEGADKATAEQKAQMEVALQNRQALNEAASNSGELEMLQNRANLGLLQQPTFDDVLKSFADSGAKTASAATTAADAAKTTAEAATIAANGVQTGKVNTAGASPQVLDAIKRAANETGVDYNLMLAIAKRESSFDPHAIPKDKNGPTSTARGLYQFTYDTAKSGGLISQDTTKEEYVRSPGKAFDASYSALAAGQYIKQITSELAAKLPDEHKITNTDTYAAYVLGASGAASLIKNVAAHPNQQFTDLGAFAKKDAAANKQLLQGKTVKQVYDSFGKMMEGAGANAASHASLMGGLDEVDGKTLTDKFTNLNKEYTAVFAGIDPGEAASAKLQGTVDKLLQLKSKNEALKSKGLPGQEEVIPNFNAQMKRLQARLELEVSDARNPFSKDARIAGEEQQVMALRLKGLSSEADFQDKLNKLKEVGYDITKLDTQANRDSAKAIERVAEAQKSQLDVINALNSARQAQIARTGSARDVAFSQALAQYTKPGEKPEDALARLSPKTVANINRAVDINEASRRDDVTYRMQGQMSEMQATARLDPQTKSYRENFKSYLKEITGSQSDSLDQIAAAAKAADIDMAKSYADLKEKLENPPGFQRWADSLEPLSKKLEDIKANFAESLSSNIADALSGEKVDWSKMFKDAQKQLIKAQVDNFMGNAIGFLTGKKPQKPEDIVAKAAQEQAAAAHSQTNATGAFKSSVDDFNMAVNSFTQAVNTAAQAASPDAAPTTGSVAAAPESSKSGASTAEGGTHNWNAMLQDGQSGGGGGGGGGVSSLLKSLSGGGSPSGGGLGDIASAVSSAASGGGDVASQIAALGPLTQSSVEQVTPVATNLLTQMPDITSSLSQDTLPALTNFTPPGGGGFLSGLMNMFTGGGAGGGGGFLSGLMNMFTGGGGAGKGGGLLGSLMNMFTGGGGAGGAGKGGGGVLGLLGGVGSLLYKLFHKNKVKHYLNQGGMIGEARPVTVTPGEVVAAHSNPIGSVLSMATSMFGGTGFGALGGNLTSAFSAGGGGFGQLFSGGMSGWLGRMSPGLGGMFDGIGKMFGGSGGMSALAGLYSEGGYAGSPVARAAVPTFSWANAPHYSEGTPNTSGGMPAILHPNEAVVPLSRGRSIPVEMPDGAMGGNNTHVTSNITVIAPNPDAFRQSRGSIQRQTNRDLKRAAHRNLTP